MPLLEGSSHESISKNISELIRSGRKPAQAIAIAYRKAGLTRKRRKSKNGKK